MTIIEKHISVSTAKSKLSDSWTRPRKHGAIATAARLQCIRRLTANGFDQCSRRSSAAASTASACKCSKSSKHVSNLKKFVFRAAALKSWSMTKQRTMDKMELVFSGSNRNFNALNVPDGSSWMIIFRCSELAFLKIILKMYYFRTNQMTGSNITCLLICPPTISPKWSISIWNVLFVNITDENLPFCAWNNV